MLEYLADPAEADKTPFLLSTEARRLSTSHLHKLLHLFIDCRGAFLLPGRHFSPGCDIPRLGRAGKMFLDSCDPGLSEQLPIGFFTHSRIPLTFWLHKRCYLLIKLL